MLPQPVFVPETKCYCKRTPKLDSYGHHLSAGCAKGGTLHKTHDTMKFVIKDICNFAGLVTRIEEVRCFQEADPECNLRPDVSLYNFPYNNTALQGRKMILDVAFTHPKTESFIDGVLSYMLRNEDARSRSALQFYWYAKLSCSLQKCIANAILSKSRLINGSLTRIDNLKQIENFLADYNNLDYCR